MHEATVASVILKHVDRQIADATSVVVAKVYVSVGEFSNVDPDSLRFAFDSMKSSWSVCQAAELVVRKVPAIASCSKGGHEYRVLPEQGYRCTECGGGIGKLISGEELDITDIELQVFDEKEYCADARTTG